jgi:hypothetical protein
VRAAQIAILLRLAQLFKHTFDIISNDRLTSAAALGIRSGGSVLGATAGIRAVP